MKVSELIESLSRYDRDDDAETDDDRLEFHVDDLEAV